MGTYIDELSELVPFLSPNIAHEYKDFMVENSLPLKTINRRLSTLRHLSKFLTSSQIIDLDFTGGIQNTGIIHEKSLVPASLIDSFSSHLEAQKISRNTIKNYQSDIRQFLAWLEKNHARFA
jgi:site-specific recombinase XerD